MKENKAVFPPLDFYGQTWKNRGRGDALKKNSLKSFFSTLTKLTLFDFLVRSPVLLLTPKARYVALGVPGEITGNHSSLQQPRNEDWEKDATLPISRGPKKHYPTKPAKRNRREKVQICLEERELFPRDGQRMKFPKS